MASKTFEVEQKYRVPPELIPELEARLGKLNPERKPILDQVDTYFAHPQRDFGQTDEALRLRQMGEANYVTYKGPKIDQTTKTRREIEFPLPPGEAGAEQFKLLLTALSFQPVLTVTKKRRPHLIEWQNQQVEIALDTVERLGYFSELEIAADESELDAARDALATLAEHLGLQQPVRTSYLELLMEALGKENPPAT